MKSEGEIREKIDQLKDKRDRALDANMAPVARDHTVAIRYLRFALDELPEEYDP